MKKTMYIILVSIIMLFCFPILAISLSTGDIHDAVTSGDLNKVRTLLEADPSLLESKDNEGNTPLHLACSSFQATIANFLIDKGAAVNTRNNNGYTPLHLAIGGKGQDIDLIQHIIAKGADVNASLDRGITALHFAAMINNLNIVKLLIDHGADLNACDRVCYGTVLQTAINISPDEEVAKLLVKSGAKINQKFSFGNTELHLAAMKGYVDLTSLLIMHGADVNAVNDYNHTALYYAAKHGYRKTADVLISAGAKENSIVEINYGKAPQLTEKLNKDEAYLWYLDGLYGGGYAIKTKEHLIIFDKTRIDESPEAGLANGNLNPKELAGQKITVFVTKAMGLNYEKQALTLAKQIPDINWVMDVKPAFKDSSEIIIPPYKLAVPHKNLFVGGIMVRTIPAIGRGYGGAVGVGYLVEVDGIRIFYSGFHVSGYDASEIERYHRTIDSLKSFAPIDIAILTVSGHLTVAYEPYLYLLDQLSPKAVYLMGGNAATEEYPKCASVLQVRNIPVKYPECGRAIGERFHYFTDLEQK